MGTLQLALEAAGGAALFSGVAYCWISVVGGAARRERARLKAHDRAHRAHYAAVEAAEDDPSFSPLMSVKDPTWVQGPIP